MKGHLFHARVYYAETDAGGVMYHTNYLAFAERARTEALRDAGLPHARMGAEHGVMFMVRRAEIEYLEPARLDTVVTVRTATQSLTAATVTLSQDFFAGDRPLAVARIVLVCVHITSGKPARIPPRWRQALALDSR